MPVHLSNEVQDSEFEKMGNPVYKACLEYG
jgi:hypothetical protein